MTAPVRTALTPTEERIVRLVAATRSNPEVAAELRIARPTVEWHLWRVYRKLGVRSRAELAELIGGSSFGPEEPHSFGRGGPES